MPDVFNAGVRVSCIDIRSLRKFDVEHNRGLLNIHCLPSPVSRRKGGGKEGRRRARKRGRVKEG